MPTQVRVLKIDAVSQMRVEYQNAIVHQARVQQAQRLREEIQSKADELGDAVKSAMCPFLVLEVSRDHLIEDTLNQIYLKVSGLDSRSTGLTPSPPWSHCIVFFGKRDSLYSQCLSSSKSISRFWVIVWSN